MDRKRRGNPFRIPLMLTREMKLATDRLNVQLRNPSDFSVALQIYRAGLLSYDVLETQELTAMYQRSLIGDDEALFLIENKLTVEFRPVKIEPILQATEKRVLHDSLIFIAENWDGLNESNKQRWYRDALLNPSLPGAKLILERCNRREACP